MSQLKSSSGVNSLQSQICWRRRPLIPTRTRLREDFIALEPAAHPWSETVVTPVCTENLNRHIMVMAAAKYRRRIDRSDSLDVARNRRILFQ
jgi:hypothetical protein